MVERRDLLPNANRWPFYRIEPLGADGEGGPHDDGLLPPWQFEASMSASRGLRRTWPSQRLPTCWRTAGLSEFDFIAAMDDFVRGRVAQVVQDREYGGTHLRSDCIFCAHVQRAFLHQRVFSEVRVGTATWIQGAP